MQIKSIDHINLSVSSLEESTAFYGDLFGFSVVERGIYNGAPWAIVRSGDSMLCMYEHRERKSPEEATANAHRVNHIGFRVSDGPAFETLLESKNVAVEYGSSFRRPHSTSWYVIDPSGHEIEVTAWDDDRVTFDAIG